MTGKGGVEVVVLLDAYAYHETPNDPSSPRVDVEPPRGSVSTRGVEISVPQEELDRARKMDPPGLAKKGSRDAKAATGGLPPANAQVATTPAGEPIEGLTVEPDEPDVEQQ
jgi:hypothetical protein